MIGTGTVGAYGESELQKSTEDCGRNLPTPEVLVRSLTWTRRKFSGMGSEDGERERTNTHYSLVRIYLAREVSRTLRSVRSSGSARTGGLPGLNVPTPPGDPCPRRREVLSPDP